MMPDGCQLKASKVSCHSTDKEVRGMLLANFQLFSMVLAILVAVVVAYGYAASRFGHATVGSLYTVHDELDQD